MANVMKYWPIAAAIFAVTSAGLTAQFQIQLNKAEIIDLSENIDEMEQAIEELNYRNDG